MRNDPIKVCEEVVKVIKRTGSCLDMNNGRPRIVCPIGVTDLGTALFASVPTVSLTSVRRVLAFEKDLRVLMKHDFLDFPDDPDPFLDEPRNRLEQFFGPPGDGFSVSSYPG